MHKIQVNGSAYSIQKKIGEGYTAEVYKAISFKGEPLCFKIINEQYYRQPEGKELIDNQIRIIGKLSHGNILKFYTQEFKGKMMIVTEYCDGGTLYQYLQLKKSLEEGESLHIMRQVIQGCSYLHESGVLHRDLKPQNIFFKDKVVKIADFGFAVQKTNSKLMKANVGSPLYMPYQVLTNHNFSQKSDVFAIGVMWYELLTGKTPFEARSEKQLKQKIKNNYMRGLEVRCCKELKALIMECLSKNDKERPNLKQLKEKVDALMVGHNKLGRTMSVIIQGKMGGAIKQGKLGMAEIQINVEKNRKDQNKKKQTAKGRTQTAKGRTKSTLQSYINTNILTKNKENVQPSTKKRQLTNSKQDQSEHQTKASQQLPTLLKKLSILNLSFLPHYLQLKFLCLLRKYSILINKAQQSDQTDGVLQIKGSEQLQRDQLIVKLSDCNNERQFCRCAMGFMRRLMRLARSYREWAHCLTDLGDLWEIIQKCGAQQP